MIQKPKRWRTGQTIFNFLEFLRTEKGLSENQSYRMVNCFHLSDKEWDEYYKEFLEKYD